MAIELYTSSGWSHLVNLDDQLFSTFLEPYRELEENVPKRIEITDSVAEIIKEEWPAYTKLVELIKECEATEPEGEGEIDKSYSDTTPYMVDVVTGVPREDSRVVEVPGLHSLSRLSRILTLPKGWEKYVYVDERTPQLERFTHILSQGKYISTRGRSIVKYLPVIEITTDYYDFSLSLLWFMLYYLYQRAEHITELEIRKNDMRLVSRIFCGFARNSILRGCNRSNLMWSDVIWQDIIPLCHRELSKPISSLSPIAIVIDALTGVRIHDSNDNDIFTISLATKYNKSNLDIFNYSVAVPSLYHRVLSAFPDDVKPRDIGLGRMIDDTYQQVALQSSMQVKNFVTWAHSVVLSTYYDRIHSKKKYKKIQDHHKNVVHIMALTFIGREGLRRILLSLLHSLDDTSRKRSTNAFATAIEEYLESEPTSEEGTCKLDHTLIDLVISK